MNLVLTPAKLRGSVTPPPSKSQAHRAMLAAALAGGGSRIDNVADSQDMLATRGCLAALMAPETALPRLDCGESGSTLRFLIPLALVLRGGGIFTGRGRLMERPQEPYFALFREKGVSYQQKDGALIVSGRLFPGKYTLPGDVSSQFITGLLYALPLLAGDSEISLSTALESKGYVDMTLDVLARFGIAVHRPDPRTFRVPGGQAYHPHHMRIEGDYSQAAFFLAANGLGSDITLSGMNPDSIQGDRVFLEYAAQMAHPGEVVLDVSQCPDLVPALAVRAALRAGETTRIVNAARLRIKESDRLDTVSAELGRLGAHIEQTADALTILGVPTFTGGDVDSHNDHRIAMMLAVAATCATEPLRLFGAESVEKSYPNFWVDYAALGGLYREVQP